MGYLRGVSLHLRWIVSDLHRAYTYPLSSAEPLCRLWSAVQERKSVGADVNRFDVEDCT